MTTPDHLVVAATTLADGIEYVADITGVAPQPGGRHVAMGTHNALLRLGERFYLEIIAIDPEGTPPPRLRWFGLDDIALQAELMVRPRLIHWVARTEAIERLAVACPMPLGPIHPMARGDFRWRITIPDDGALPGKGVVPTLIQWDVPVHPADKLPNSSVSLDAFAATHSGSDAGSRRAREARPGGRRSGELRPRNAAGGNVAHAARRGHAVDVNRG